MKSENNKNLIIDYLKWLNLDEALGDYITIVVLNNIIFNYVSNEQLNNLIPPNAIFFRKIK